MEMVGWKKNRLRALTVKHRWTEHLYFLTNFTFPPLHLPKYTFPAICKLINFPNSCEIRRVLSIYAVKTMPAPILNVATKWYVYYWVGSLPARINSLLYEPPCPAEYSCGAGWLEKDDLETVYCADDTCEDLDCCDQVVWNSMSHEVARVNQKSCR